ncbi:MAG: bifunctional 5,10-methylene-tetrahydrofolate dehydrogenase/5,10-methylene-tetrahydrofolate cyclohydrolase [Chloroflexota bacterium]|nr:bifunctional 5,10-methylene-tetrahydrofolate dehydrogenase/5,10-methylene-tetrahydrofolate cyclohydrolase [Chloroflexota bacterium]MDE2930790.1 bifunctional 5,10-methylene-tetrahydrofolate dehydrogenase/5,10-methylene-tetrahydrofolate cyclohydrolase [Chloroflexota bacterium]
MALVLDGNRVARTLRGRHRDELADIQKRLGHPVTLAVVRAGDDRASASYIRQIEKLCGRVGMEFQEHILSATDREQFIGKICRLNADPRITGIMLSWPLPEDWDQEFIALTLDPRKDIDGLHPLNAGRVFLGGASLDMEAFVPNTPAGVVYLLRHYEIPLRGQHAVLIGRSNVVGRPLAALLIAHDATVTITHSRTADLAGHTRQADILLVAMGKANFVTPDMVKPGAVVVDIGINVTADGLVGDVQYDAVSEVASAITPVPGGVGPVTNAMLVANTIRAARLQSTLA